MSASVFGKKDNKTSTTTTASQTDPWDETIPYLKDFLGKLGTASPALGQSTDTQTKAISDLEGIAGQGNPYAGDIDKLTKDLFGTESQSPTVQNGYEDLKRRLTPTADGVNLDNITNDPQLQKLLQMVGDDTASRINSQFAGAGRDLSGINQKSVARGVGQAQLPILVDQLNKEKARTDDAARTLFNDSVTTGTATSALDAQADAARKAGIDTGQAALDAKTQGPSALLSLEEMKKQMPFDELSWLSQLLYGAAGLGNQTSGTAQTKSAGTTFGGSIGIKL